VVGYVFCPLEQATVAVDQMWGEKNTLEKYTSQYQEWYWLSSSQNFSSFSCKLEPRFRLWKTYKICVDKIQFNTCYIEICKVLKHHRIARLEYDVGMRSYYTVRKLFVLWHR